MLHFNNNKVYTDSPDKQIRRLSTGEILGRNFCGYIGSEDNYEEVSTAECRAEAEAAARRQSYVERVRAAVHERYSVDDEAAVLRKAVAVICDPEATAADRAAAITEFSCYNDYVNECKAQAAAEGGTA